MTAPTVATPTVSRRLEQFELDLRPAGSAEPLRQETPNRTEAPQETVDRQPAAGVTTLEHPKVVSHQPVRHVLAPTNDLIDQMWTANPEATDLAGWKIQELDTEGSVVARRVFLGTILTVGLAFLVASAWFLAGRGDATVEATVNEIEEASISLSETLLAVEPVIGEFATGALGDREVAIAASTAVDGAARTLFGHASELPTDEEWADLRSTTVSLSDRSIALARLLSRTTSYMATIDVMFNRPAYPLAADDTEIGDVAEMTAIWVSRFIATSSSLPEVNALDGHSAEIDALAARLPDWQSAYLDALRAGDVDAVGATVGDLEETILSLEADLDEAVKTIAQELEAQQSALLTDLEG